MATTSNPDISLAPVVDADYPAIARLEAAAFADDEWSDATFGRDRKSDEAMVMRATSLALAPPPGEVVYNMKAVLAGGGEGSQRIVGFASWVFCDRSKQGVRGAEGQQEKKDGAEEEVRMLPPGANAKLFEDSILKGDEFMDVSTQGKDYAKLRNLVVSPECQRKGIGAALLADGLREADARGLQAVLGASSEGLGLYQKHGFVIFKSTSFNLWEYEGGEGMGVAKHYIMHRPAARSQ